MRASLTLVRAILLITALAVLPACAVRISSNTGSSVASASASVSNGTPFGTAVIVGVMAADAVRYYRVGPDGRTPVYGAPEPDPTRAINVQDCTQPVDVSAGNLLCR